MAGASVLSVASPHRCQRLPAVGHSVADPIVVLTVAASRARLWRAASAPVDLPHRSAWGSRSEVAMAMRCSAAGPGPEGCRSRPRTHGQSQAKAAERRHRDLQGKQGAPGEDCGSAADQRLARNIDPSRQLDAVMSRVEIIATSVHLRRRRPRPASPRRTDVAQGARRLL